MHWPALTALDAVTAVCAGFNSLYFLNRLLWLDGQDRGRWAAVAVLALISVAMLLEGVSRLAAGPAGGYEEGPGRVLVSGVSMAASVGVTAMLVRRIGR